MDLKWRIQCSIQLPSKALLFTQAARSSWPSSQQGNLMPVSLCAESWAAHVCKCCLSTGTGYPASPLCLLRKGAVVLSLDAIIQAIPLPCPSTGAILQSHVVLKGKGKLCRWHGSVRILFLFLLRKQPADRSSAPYKNGCVPFSPLPVGMSVSVFCGAAPCHRQNQCHKVVPFPWNSFTRLGTQLLVAFTASVKGMVHILCHGCLDVWLPSFLRCRGADSHHMYQGQCVQIAEY